MAGRNDFGILRSEFFSDDRAHRAAELYTERLHVPEALAFAAVCGHVVALGLWAMRETDDGILPNDGVAAAHVATLMPRSACRDVLAALKEAKLLREEPSGLYIVGFRDCYGSIIEAREVNAEAKRVARAEARASRKKRLDKLASKTSPKAKAEDVPETSDGHPQDIPGTSDGCPSDIQGTSGPTVPCRSVPFRAVPCRSGPNPPSSANGHGGGGSAVPSDGERNGHTAPGPADSRQVAGARAMAAVILAGKDVSQARREDARTIIRSLDAGSATADEISAFAERHFARTECRIAYLAPP